MTREEQYQTAATAYEQSLTIDHDSVDVELDFIAGCEWADTNRWVRIEDGVPDTNEKFHESDHLLCYDEGTGTMFIGWYN